MTACGRICGLILALMIDGNDAIAKFNEAFEYAQGFPWVDGAKVETLVTEFRKLLDRVKDIEENSRGNSKKGRFDTYFTAIREFILKKAMRMLIFEPWAITEVDRKMMFTEPPQLHSKEDTPRMKKKYRVWATPLVWP